MILKIIRIILAVALLLLSWLIAMGNNEPVRLTFMGWETPQLPLFVWLLTILFFGLLVGVVMGRFSRKRQASR